MAIYSYMPELGEKAPANVDGSADSFMGHWYVKTPLTLKGRGIKLLRVLQASDLVASAQHKAGWNEYSVTRRAMDDLRQKYNFSRVSLLD